MFFVVRAMEGIGQDHKRKDLSFCTLFFSLQRKLLSLGRGQKIFLSTFRGKICNNILRSRHEVNEDLTFSMQQQF